LFLRRSGREVVRNAKEKRLKFGEDTEKERKENRRREGNREKIRPPREKKKSRHASS
jgi:hypothetical protein